MRTRVKICGFTRAEEAVYAAHQGADAIGLVFYPASPRNVTIEQAMTIVNALPAFTTVVALFVDETEARIREVLHYVPIDCLQFHGDEPASACRIYGKRYIKAVRMQATTDVAQLAEQYHDAAGLLLDAYHADAKGGTGQSFDWELIPKQCALPIILAGGLDAANAKQAIQAVRPYALDVSSGVESSKGIKDALKVTAFMQQVNVSIHIQPHPQGETHQRIEVGGLSLPISEEVTAKDNDSDVSSSNLKIPLNGEVSDQ